MKKKILSALLAALVLMALTVGALAADEGFNAGLTVTPGAGETTVEVDDSDATNDILASEEPTLTIPCDYAEAYVEYGGEVIASNLAEGKISFRVKAGGVYTIKAGEAPEVPVDPDKPVDPPVDPEEPVDPPVDPEEPDDKPEKPWVPPVRPTEPDKPDEKPEEKPDKPAPERPAHAFTDVAEDAWYGEAVDYVYGADLMDGVSATEFAPNTTTSRAMIWTVLARMDGVDTSGGDTWYAVGRAWAMENAVSDGTEPGAPITREQLAAMLWRWAGEPKASYTALAAFPDGDTVSGWAVEAMAWAVESGVIGGLDGQLAPRATATRAQVAVMLLRFGSYIG